MQKMAWLIWTEPDPEMIKAKGVWGIQRERMTERIWLMLFFFLFFFPFCEKRQRCGGGGGGGLTERLSTEQPDRLVFEGAQRRDGGRV